MLELKNIRKSFGSLEVLKGIDLVVRDGDVLALLGPSGTGKTTLLRCINFLEKPQTGEVTIGGQTVHCRRPAKKEIISLRRKTAMVFQSYNLFMICRSSRLTRARRILMSPIFMAKAAFST